jgi:microcystin-dependent protein
MGSAYQRADTANNISNGNIVNADDFDAEFNAIEAAFNGSTGHSHDGTTGEGGPITVVGPTQDLIVSGTQVLPKLDNAIDLGSATFEYKDLYIDGIANIDSLVADTADLNGGTIDNVVIGGTTPAAGTFTTLTVGGTSIPTGSALVTLTATQTLLNKTINLANNTVIATSEQIRAMCTDETGAGALVFAQSPVFTGTPTAPTPAPGTNTTQVATAASVFAERTNTATLTNKTINLSDNTLQATSAQLRAALSDETGTGPAVFGTAPTITNPVVNGSTLTSSGAAIDAAVAAPVPAGAVMAFAMNTAPTGWLAADGSAVSRTTYAALFAAIGTTYGAGDGTTTFNVPELRGEFIRGLDNSRGVDPSRTLGSAQAAAMLNHIHSGTTAGGGAHTHNILGGATTGAGATVLSRTTSPNPTEYSGLIYGVGDHTHGFNTGNPSAGGGSETRPRNIAMLYCIKT